MNDLLLVIDMQNVYLPDQPWACETVAHTKANILKLLEKHPKNQTIFTRYIAAEHPVGTWKTYNELNRKINEDPWMNEPYRRLLVLICQNKPAFGLKKSNLSSICRV